MKAHTGILVTESNDSSEEMDVYDDDVNRMDSLIVTVATLELMSGIFGIMLTMFHFSNTFYPSPLIYTIASVSYGSIIGALAAFSLIASWGLWRLERWAWRIALAISIASLVAYLPTLSPIMVPLNIIIIWLLRKPEVENSYTEIILP